jgi:hypothetical protein
MQTCIKRFSGLNLLILASAKRIPKGMENSSVKKKINSVVPNPPMICCTIDMNPIWFSPYFIQKLTQKYSPNGLYEKNCSCRQGSRLQGFRQKTACRQGSLPAGVHFGVVFFQIPVPLDPGLLPGT